MNRPTDIKRSQKCERSFLQFLPCSHLAGGRSIAVPTQHRVVGHLHDEEIVVDQRPRALHLARLELVGEGAQVGVPEQTAVVEGSVAMVPTLVGHLAGWGRDLLEGVHCRSMHCAIVLLHAVLEHVAHAVVVDATLAAAR